MNFIKSSEYYKTLNNRLLDNSDGKPSNPNDFINKKNVEFANDYDANNQYYNIVKPNLVECFNKNIKNSSEFTCPLYNFFDTFLNNNVNKKPGMENKIKKLFETDLRNKDYDFYIYLNADKFHININN